MIEHAVFGMLPKGRQGRSMHNRLKVYAGERHPHVAQNPQKLDITNTARTKNNEVK